MTKKPETAGSLFAKIITDKLEGREVSKEREQEFVDQAAKQTGGQVSLGGVSSTRGQNVAEEDEPFTHCYFCDEPIMEESEAIEDNGGHFCDEDCLAEMSC